MTRIFTEDEHIPSRRSQCWFQFNDETVTKIESIVPRPRLQPKASTSGSQTSGKCVIQRFVRPYNGLNHDVKVGEVADETQGFSD